MQACSNGGEALYLIAGHYFGRAGTLILAVTVSLACLKTAVGLITSCAETFGALFPKGPGYRIWTILFTLTAFLIANLGLNSIIAYSVPALMLLYPLGITLILLALFGRFFGHDRRVYVSVTVFTFAAAILDFLHALPEGLQAVLHTDFLMNLAERYLPFFGLGMGWICPTAIGLLIGLAVRAVGHSKKK